MVVAVAVAACGTTMYRPEYTVVMREIRLLAGPSGAPVQTPSPDAFVDDWLDGHWHVSERLLYLEVRNALTSPLWVRWDQASFVGVDGSRHALTLRDAQRTTLRPFAAQEQGHLDLYPSDYLVLEDGKPVVWKSTPLIPNMPGVANSDLARVEAFARQQIGASFRLELPVESAAGRRVYAFAFEVKSFTPLKIRAT